MPWLQLRLEVLSSQAEPLEALLLGSGAVAVTMENNGDQPVLEPGVGETPLWGHARLTGLFEASADMANVLAQFPSDVLAKARYRVEILEDKDWEREWIKHYQPMKFGERLWVCPSWLEAPEPAVPTLLLDPGLAFGTGTHPTTALCLEALAGMDLNAKTVVDYGCGSGILGIASLLLGAGRMLGVDNDPQALAASNENGLRNHIEAARLIAAAPEDVDHAQWAGQADLVIANILAGPLMALSPVLLGLLKPGGTLMLSGLISEQSNTVIEHYQPWLELAVAGEHEEWICLLGTCPNH